MNRLLRSTLSLAIALSACASVTSPRAHGDAPTGAFALNRALAALEYVVPTQVRDAPHPRPPSLSGLAKPLYTLQAWAWEHDACGHFSDWNSHVNRQ